MALPRIDTASAFDSSKLKLPLAPSGDMKIRMSYQHPCYKQFIHNNRYIDSIWLNRYKKVVMYIDIGLEQIYGRGLSIGLFRRLLVNQLNEQTQHIECPICKGNLNSGHPKLAIDHDHKTGKVRGVLHTMCNTALGEFYDNISYLESAIAYLSKDYSNNRKYNDLSQKDITAIRKELISKNNEQCPICNNNLVLENRNRGKKSPHLDHSHSEDYVRDVICLTCNMGLGGFKDDIKIIRNAIAYLHKNESSNSLLLPQ